MDPLMQLPVELHRVLLNEYLGPKFSGALVSTCRAWTRRFPNLWQDFFNRNPRWVKLGITNEDELYARWERAYAAMAQSTGLRPVGQAFRLPPHLWKFHVHNFYNKTQWLSDLEAQKFGTVSGRAAILLCRQLFDKYSWLPSPERGPDGYLFSEKGNEDERCERILAKLYHRTRPEYPVGYDYTRKLELHEPNHPMKVRTKTDDYLFATAADTTIISWNSYYYRYFGQTFYDILLLLGFVNPDPLNSDPSRCIVRFYRADLDVNLRDFKSYSYEDVPFPFALKAVEKYMETWMEDLHRPQADDWRPWEKRRVWRVRHLLAYDFTHRTDLAGEAQLMLENSRAKVLAAAEALCPAIPGPTDPLCRFLDEIKFKQPQSTGNSKQKRTRPSKMRAMAILRCLKRAFNFLAQEQVRAYFDIVLDWQNASLRTINGEEVPQMTMLGHIFRKTQVQNYSRSSHPKEEHYLFITIPKVTLKDKRTLGPGLGRQGKWPLFVLVETVGLIDLISRILLDTITRTFTNQPAPDETERSALWGPVIQGHDPLYHPELKKLLDILYTAH